MAKEHAPAKANGESESGKTFTPHPSLSLPQRHLSNTTSVIQDVDGWIMTYIDVITLLLTLFVMLLAYSTQNQYGFEEIQDSLKGVVSRPHPQVAQEVSEKQRIQEKVRQFSAQLEQKQLDEDVSYYFEEGKLVLQFGERILFPSGQAALTPSGLSVMMDVLPVLSGSDYTIVIEGHTDNVPISNQQYPSNWELSSARSAAVVRYLTDHGISPKRISAVGFADTRPIGDNRTESGRAKNRRVTFSVSYKEKVKE